MIVVTEEPALDFNAVDFSCRIVVIQKRSRLSSIPNVSFIQYDQKQIDRAFRSLENYNLELSHPMFFENFN